MFQTITLQNVINNNENYVRVCRLFGWSAYLLFFMVVIGDKDRNSLQIV